MIAAMAMMVALSGGDIHPGGAEALARETIGERLSTVEPVRIGELPQLPRSSWVEQLFTRRPPGKVCK